MALKIRLRQQGRTNLQTYRLVVTDVRSPRDGKYVEALGWYNPMVNIPEKSLFVNSERVQFWLDQGAELTESAKTLVGKISPAIVRGITEKMLAKRTKEREKRKARKVSAKA